MFHLFFDGQKQCKNYFQERAYPRSIRTHQKRRHSCDVHEFIDEIESYQPLRIKKQLLDSSIINVIVNLNQKLENNFSLVIITTENHQDYGELKIKTKFGHFEFKETSEGLLIIEKKNDSNSLDNNNNYCCYQKKKSEN